MKLDGQPVSDQIWEAIRAEFALPSLGQVRRRLSELTEDPEPVMQQLVRVIGEGTFCPGFQFLAGGQLHPTVVELFHQRAMDLKIAHNYFTVWMVTPSSSLAGARPVDLLDSGPQPLFRALETLGKEQSPEANRSRSVGA